MRTARAGSAARAGAEVALLAAALLIAAPALAGAQELLAKRALPALAPESCAPAGPAAAPPPAEVRERVRLLLATAQQAVLADELADAERSLAEAARLDPGDADVAYHLARLREETGDAAGAAGEFCRFLVLAADSPDADDARERLLRLAEGAPDPRLPPEVVEQFSNGVVYLDRGDFRDAVRAFTFVLHHRPDLAAAHFNRGLAHLGARRRDPGVRDLEAYLSLAPDASDRDAVFQRIGSARTAATISARSVLVRGIVVPGLGQYATHRPVHGAVVTLATGGALALALQTRETERTVTFVDPFGTPREYVRPHSERPYAASGIAAAVAITTLGALEAYFHSRRAANPGAGAERAAPRAVFDGDADGVRLGVRIAVGQP